MCEDGWVYDEFYKHHDVSMSIGEIEDLLFRIKGVALQWKDLKLVARIEFDCTTIIVVGKRRETEYEKMRRLERQMFSKERKRKIYELLNKKNEP